MIHTRVRDRLAEVLVHIVGHQVDRRAEVDLATEELDMPREGPRRSDLLRDPGGALDQDFVTAGFELLA